MNLISVAAAYGVVTAVFQLGWGASLIGLDESIPIVSFVLNGDPVVKEFAVSLAAVIALIAADPAPAMKRSRPCHVSAPSSES